MPRPRRRRTVSPLVAGLLVLTGLMPRGPVYLWHDHQDHAHVEFHLAAHGAHSSEHEHLESHDRHHAGHPSEHHAPTAPDEHDTPVGPTWADNSHHHHELTPDDSLRAARDDASTAAEPVARLVALPHLDSPTSFRAEHRPRPPRDRPGPLPGLAAVRTIIILV